MASSPRGAAKVVAASVVAVTMMGCGGGQPEPAAPVAVESDPVEQPAEPPIDTSEPVEEGELPPPVPEEEAEVPVEEDVERPPAVVMYGPPPTGQR